MRTLAIGIALLALAAATARAEDAPPSPIQRVADKAAFETLRWSWCVS